MEYSSSQDILIKFTKGSVEFIDNASSVFLFMAGKYSSITCYHKVDNDGIDLTQKSIDNQINDF